VDLSKPPTRLKVVLLSLPPRTQAVLDYFFSSTGRSSFSPTSADIADAAIFDLDTLESRHHWEAFHGGTGRPGIAMSIQPQQVPGAVWVRKPITPAALLHAAAELHAGRWARAEAVVDVPAAPAPAPAIDAPAVVAPAPAVAAPAPVVAEPVVAVPLPVPVSAPVAAPAPAPAPVAVVAEPPVVVPAVASAPIAITPAVVAAPVVSSPRTSVPPAVSPAPAPVAAPVAAPITAPVRAPSPPAIVAAPPVRTEPPVKPVIVNAPAPTPAPAPVAGFTGLFKRLFGAALGKTEPTPGAVSPMTPASAAPPAPRGNPVAIEPAAVVLGVVEPATVGSGWHEVPAGEEALNTSSGQSTASRSPAQSGAHKPVVAGSKSNRKRGRKGSTRWVDPGMSGAGSASSHPSSTSAATDAETDDDLDDDMATPASTPVDAVWVEASAPAASEPVAEPDVASLADLAPHDDVEGSAPRRPSGWGESAADHDPAAEVLLCGSREDWPEARLASEASLRYDPALTVVAAMTEAYLVGGKWRVPTHFDCSAGRITVDSTRNRVHMNFDARLLPGLYASSLDKRLKTNTLNRNEHAELMSRIGETDWQPLDRVLWRAGMETGRGRLPNGVDLRTTVYLKHWPNLTRLQRTPHALRIAALWAIRGASLLETTELLHISQRHVFAFYNAALAMDLITEDGSQIRRSQRKSQRNRGLLTRLFGWLHK
jgi:hypothetical protein